MYTMHLESWAMYYETGELRKIGWALWVAGVLLWSTLPVGADQQVPCFFVFGDSLVDNGNNNIMASVARADYSPYGIDFPQGPTGRFCNGKTAIDVVTELLGFNHYIPPFSMASGRTLLSGVNYASAAAGIQQETGRQLGERTDFSGQVSNHRTTVSIIARLLGNENNATEYLSKCIYSVGMGSNDYLNNYFMPGFYDSGFEYKPDQYADLLIKQYAQQLHILYDSGARKVALAGVGMVGCSPNVLARYSSDGAACVDRINNAIEIFNKKLVQVVDGFNANHAGAKFTFINTFKMLQYVLSNPSASGFTNTNSGCCGVGRNNGQITCLPLQTPCTDRNRYVFWDAFHPSEAANAIFGQRAYIAQSPSDAYPYDFRTLARM